MRTSAQLVPSPEPDVRRSAPLIEANAPARSVSQRSPFEDVYETHVEFVFRNAQRLGVADGALDDVVQQVFLVVHRRLAEVAGDAPIKAWVFGILTHVVRDYRRALRRKSPHNALPPIDPATLAEPAGRGPFDALARSEALEVVVGLLQELTDEKREIFVLSELEQLTAQEISELIGVNASTVYSRLRAARQDFERAVERSRLRDTWRLR
ncbi:MAG TPA: RNA polymerase sigma factor [Polyangiaceae bacterium]|nr:RNA polymerase sigma factor [Polyangiaceae bacterium]